MQWARASPGDWELATCAQVTAEAGAPVPDGTQVLQVTDRRYINCFNVQGNLGRADHYAFVELADGGTEITQWDDDPDDWDPADFIARRIVLPPLRADAALGGLINTAGRQTIYAGPRKLAELLTPRANGTIGYDNATIFPLSDFVEPDPSVTLHGIWMSDDLFAAHDQVTGLRGWREWCDHLGDEYCEIVSGRRSVRDGARVSSG